MYLFLQNYSIKNAKKDALKNNWSENSAVHEPSRNVRKWL